MNYIFTGLGKGTYKLHILHKGNKEWFEVQDLHVKEILPPMITLSESYIQVKSFNWKLKRFFMVFLLFVLY